MALDRGEGVVRDRGGDGDKKGEFDSGKLLRPVSNEI